MGPFVGCFPGQVQLTNSVNVSTDTGIAYVGYPEVCVNGNFTPICNETELGAVELIFICAYQRKMTHTIKLHHISSFSLFL